MPAMINSLVPTIRPGRPADGWVRNRFTLFSMVSAKCAAASGLSREIYSAIVSKSDSAVPSHLTRTRFPLSEGRLNLSIARELPRVGFFDRGFDSFDLPFVEIDKRPNRFRGDLRFGTVHRLRQFFEAGFGLAIDAYRYDFRHAVIVRDAFAFNKQSAFSDRLEPVGGPEE
jgi:hypothetical protein